MQLLMIRHSYAADPGSVAGGDFERPLTERGQQVFSHMAMWLVGRGIVPERILHSPLVRARQTAAILAQACGRELSGENARRWIGSGLPVEDLLEELRSSPAESVAIIGHEPRMSSCTSALVAGGKLRFLPATIACIRFDGPIREGQGQLEWMLSPKQFHG
jgi:phosphohistidine phosphatase